MSQRSLPTDVWQRGRSVFALAAGVASHELRHVLRTGFASSAEKIGASEVRARIEQAKLMAESLGRLKGALMKAGQLLSIDASEVLPPEAVEILSRLQGQAEPVDFSVLEGVLSAELPPEARARLVDLDPRPAASASIGQVHRATLDGRPVAVKIQYPGVADGIDSDLALLEKLGASWMTLTGRDVDLGGLFEELRAILHLEADYVRERAYLDRFAGLLAGDDRFAVPQSEAALSTARVLTMSWEEGQPLGAWIREAPPISARVAVGRALLDLYCREFFEWGVVQTDPNFGNFLVRAGDAPDPRLVLLDFGATVEYDADFRRRYVSILRAVERRDRGRIIDEGIAFELLDAREPAASRELFADMLFSAAEPFSPARQPFAFRDSDYAASSRDITTRFVKSLRFSAPPRRLIFLHRKLGGLFQLLKRLDIELDLVPYWRRMIA